MRLLFHSYNSTVWNSKDNLKDLASLGSEVKEVQLTHAEYNQLTLKVRNIPVFAPGTIYRREDGGYYITYFGDTAKFIVANAQYIFGKDE